MKLSYLKNWLCIKSRHRLAWCPTCKELKRAMRRAKFNVVLLDMAIRHDPVMKMVMEELKNGRRD